MLPLVAGQLLREAVVGLNDLAQSRAKTAPATAPAQPPGSNPLRTSSSVEQALVGIPSRLVILSNAGHWPSWYEMALYYTAHLEWFQKHLGGGAPPWTTEQFLRNAVFDRETGERVK